ncbi:MAG TPA: BatD family protein [Kiritimatiellia bacterium]|nr:BatD family protein [Kiritimatiellia bacterium]
MESTGANESIRPNHSIRSILSAFLFLAFPALADVSLKVSPSRQSIYLGESFNLTIEVGGADRGLDVPDLSGLPPAEIQFLGQHSNSRSSISIINGRMTREVYEGRVFAYQIKPNAEGVYRAGPVRVVVAGQSYTDPGPSVQVKGIERQDCVIASLSASSTSVLVEEPFTITLSVAVAELPDPYAESNEPLHPNLLPQLTADFLEIRQDTPGLKGPDLNQILNNLIDQSGRQPGFAINDYKTRDMSSGFGRLFGDDDPFRPRPIRFRLPPSRVTLNGKKYRAYTLTLDYTPTKEGEFTFGPLTFKGTVISDVTADRQAVTRDIYTIGPAVTVRVVPPPDEGRPETFIGSVGKEMQATAAFDTTVCKVGDPLTLTLEVTGAISISNLRTPLLNLQPELTRDFRIYDDNVSADTLPNGKRFKYRVRPTREGTLEFPPIRLSYYDTAARAYRTVTTAPIPIQARPTTQIATLEPTDSAEALTGMLASRTRPQPAGITLDVGGARPVSLLPHRRWVWPLLVAGPLLALLTALAAPFAALVARLRVSRRHAGALRRSLRALRRADEPARTAQAVRNYLAERCDVAGDALTPSDVAELLCRRGVPDATAQTWRRLLARLDEALYRPDTATPVSETVGHIRSLLPELDAALAEKRSVKDEA